MLKDVRSEQLSLLRFEKRLAALAAFLVAESASVASANAKIGDDLSWQAFADIQLAMINLADVTSSAHKALDENVRELGLRALEASGGIPKGDPSVIVRSIFGT